MNALDKLFDVILSMQKDITDIKEKTAVNTVNLQTHMKRTDQNEELIVLLKARVEKLELQDKIMSGLWKISVAAAGLVGTIAGIIAVIHQLR